MTGEGVPAEQFAQYGELSYQNLVKLVIDNADGIVIEAEHLPAEVEEYLAKSGKKVLRPTGDIAEEEKLTQYKEFDDSIL